MQTADIHHWELILLFLMVLVASVTALARRFQIPIHPRVCEALIKRKEPSPYRQPEDWGLASRHSHGVQSYWAQAILHKYETSSSGTGN